LACGLRYSWLSCGSAVAERWLRSPAATPQPEIENSLRFSFEPHPPPLLHLGVPSISGPTIALYFFEEYLLRESSQLQLTMTDFVSFSIFGLSLPTLLLLTATVAAGFYQLYRKAMPQPIPGIPYNRESAKSLLGDGRPMIKNAKVTHEIWSWFREQNLNLHTPISQIFLKPFANPTIIISDFKETQDICLRRTKEFDRTTAQANIFAGVVPEHHIGFKTADPKWKQHRRWLQDLMTPTFLHEIAAPYIQATFEDLIQCKLIMRR
jgi:hypothetical protein